MMPDTNALAAIRARLGKATPGPWHVEDATKNPQIESWLVKHGPFGVVAECGGIEGQDEPDATFIAHARTDVPLLLAGVDQLRAENARLREVADAAREVIDARQDRLNVTVALAEHKIERDQWMDHARGNHRRQDAAEAKLAATLEALTGGDT